MSYTRILFFSRALQGLILDHQRVEEENIENINPNKIGPSVWCCAICLVAHSCKNFLHSFASKKILL